MELKNFKGKFIEYSKEKNEIIKKMTDRKISFELVLLALEDEEKIIDIIDNPSSNFGNQKCFVLEINNYIYLVPFIEDEKKIFLKTVFPSRKHKKFYLNNITKNEK